MSEWFHRTCKTTEGILWNPDTERPLIVDEDLAIWRSVAEFLLARKDTQVGVTQTLQKLLHPLAHVGIVEGMSALADKAWKKDTPTLRHLLGEMADALLVRSAILLPMAKKSDLRWALKNSNTAHLPSPSHRKPHMKLTSPHKDPASAYATFVDGASPRRKAALDAIFAAGNAMLEEGAHITVVSVGSRTQAMPSGPTSRTIYNTPDPYGALVQTFVEAQSAKKPGVGFAEQSGHHLPSLESIIYGIADPAQKAVLRTFEHEAQRTRDRLRILEGFVAKVTAQDVAHMTGSDMAQPRGEQSPQERPVQAIPGTTLTTIASTLSDEDKKVIRTFIEDTLFDEGYEQHDGDLFHAQSGRSLRAEAFVALMQRLSALST